MKLDPPPAIQEFNFHWRSWANSLYEWLKTPNGFKAPHMTTTERNALTAENGMIIYNETTNAFNFYENGSWVTK